MYSLSLLRITITISSIICCILAQSPFPLGIHLGPKYITAATTHTNGTTSNITPIKGSTAYQFILAPPDSSTPPNTYVATPLSLTTHVAKSIHPSFYKCLYSTNPSALIPKILRTTFNSIKSSADIALGEKIRDVVITLPNHVGNDIVEAITRAARLAGYDVLVDLKFTEAVGMAYDLLGDGEREKDGDGNEFGVSVLVEYNEGGLEAWIMDDAWVLKPKGHIMFPELGVEAIVDEAADTYFLTVRRRLEGSLRRHLVKEDGTVVVLRGLVLAGDASEKGMQEMKGVLEQVLTDLGYVDVKGLVRDEVEGLYVGAVGAAKRGRDIVMFPERFKGRESERGHEEL